MPEAQDHQYEHDRREYKRRDCAIEHHVADGAERVGLEQQAAQRGAFEDRAHRALELGVFRILQSGSAGLGVDAAVRHRRQVHGDEVIGPDLGLLAAEQLLPGVLADRRNHARRNPGTGLGMRERSFGREEDLLLGQLVVNLGIHKTVAPGQQPSSHQQYHDHYNANGAGKRVKKLTGQEISNLSWFDGTSLEYLYITC